MSAAPGVCSLRYKVVRLGEKGADETITRDHSYILPSNKCSSVINTLEYSSSTTHSYNFFSSYDIDDIVTVRICDIQRGRYRPRVRAFFNFRGRFTYKGVQTGDFSVTYVFIM